MRCAVLLSIPQRDARSDRPNPNRPRVASSRSNRPARSKLWVPFRSVDPTLAASPFQRSFETRLKVEALNSLSSVYPITYLREESTQIIFDIALSVQFDYIIPLVSG